MLAKVVPDGLNYGDLKPETIDNTIKLVRFTPTSNVTDAAPNDVIRFNLQG